VSCEDIRDLIPAYSMGTATFEEVLSVEEHVAECDLHDDMRSIAATVALIGSGAESVQPPSSVKARVMGSVAASQEGESLRLVGSGGVDRSPSAVGSGRSGRSNWSWLMANRFAAVLVVAIGVMAVWNIMLQSADSPERFVHYYWGNENDWMRIETVLGEQGAEVSLGGVDRLDDAHVYHLWTTRGEQVLLVGSFNVSSEGRWAGEFEFVFLEGDRVWMTSEPASGSDQPTGDTVLRTRF
jgi:hypothetical protein